MPLHLQIPLLHLGMVVQGGTGDAERLGRLSLVRVSAHRFFWERDSSTVMSPMRDFRKAFSFRSAFISRKVGDPGGALAESQL